MHITNVQFISALFLIGNLAAYLLGRRHGRKAVRQEFQAGPVGELVRGGSTRRRRS